MKSLNKLSLAFALAISGASQALASIPATVTTVIHVTGSTAYRGSDVAAEVAYGGSNTTAIYWGSSLGGANYSIVYCPNGVAFENFFNGSIAGDTALVTPVSLAFPSAASTTYQSAATAATAAVIPVTSSSATLNGTAVGGGQAETAPSTWPTGITVNNANPDIAFSDVFFDTAQQVLEAANPPVFSTPAASAIVGVVPFVFVANASTDSSSIANLSVDPQKFTYLWSNGLAPLSFFTGNSADETTVIYALGRDIDSGTRASALAETGDGLSGSNIATTPVTQFYPYNTKANWTTDSTNADNDSTGATGFSVNTGVFGDDSSIAGQTIGWVGLVPSESVPGDNYFMTDGDGGYYSGGNLAVGMSTAFGVTKTALMTYLGVSDAKTALTASGTNRQAATLMAYNGVTFAPYYVAGTTTPAQEAANAALITEGKYTFWGYEHEFYTSTTGMINTVATALKTQLNSGLDELSAADVNFNNMVVARADDGENVQPTGAVTATNPKENAFTPIDNSIFSQE